MSIGPIVVGDTGSPFSLTLVDDSGNSVLTGLTGSALSMVMIDADTVPPVTKTCSGPWTVDNASTGQCHYVLQPADVNTAGNWDCYVTVQQTNGPQHGDPFPLQIKAQPGT